MDHPVYMLLLDEYRQVSDSVSYGGQLFTFHEQRLSWPEAASVCRSLGGYLAIVNNMELAMFLAVSHTRFDEGTEYGDVWIGGRLKNKKWIWKATGEVIPDTVPPWTPEKRNNDNHNCLTFSNDNSQPHFINKECTNLQSFLCQKGNINNCN
uniref:C-type lectin domain-containing protein n=1 Tax=Timema poppense TaxID=170557 RepID=A0A7R9HFL0_TIMPO|nr:unnamed protein product [Timema poppensis]